MKQSLFFLILFYFAHFSFSQNYSRVKVFATDFELNRLSEYGVTIDHGIRKENTFYISDFSKREIEIMHENEYVFEILISDVEAYYVAILNNENPPQELRNATCSGATSGSSVSNFTPSTPSNFNLGTMGGYLTYNAMLAELDAMAAQYPSIITPKTQISTFLSIENRPIYHLRISDNPALDENEPKVLYTAIHHAREPMSLMETIFYMWYLLENYNTNPEVTYLVNNTQMYFVPCINPDGYLYNESTNPNGGGMWRKNRRNNGGGVYGVDLNRNYSYGWGTTGTSFTTSNDTYCGTAAFSEPEVQAIRWLVQNNDFTLAFNAHAYGKLLLFPIGTTTAEFAPHHNYFQDYGNHMAEQNGYSVIKGSALYPHSGDSDDYMYKVDIGVVQKDTVFANTPEVGTAFWQPQAQIIPTCQEMVFSNLILAHLSRNYLIAKDTDPSMVATLSGNFNHSAKRLGREAGPVTVSIQALINVVSVGSPVIYNLAISQTSVGAISYSLNPTIQFGDVIKYILKTDNGLWVKNDTITKTYGALTVQAIENATAATNWTGNWSTTGSTFVSPSKSFTDTPTGNYTSNTTNTYTYVPSIDLTNASDAMISFYAKWALETDYDYTQFQVSIDGGTTWIGQCGNYTVPGTNANGSVQPNNLPVYEGTQSSWVIEEINLSDYLGQTINVRFILQSDGDTNADGYYFDDFKIMYNLNAPPATPVASFSLGTNIICQGTSLIFNDMSTNSPTTWSWDFGDNSSSIIQNPSHTFATPGTFTITLTVTNASGSSLISQNITVLPSPIVSIISNEMDSVFCITAAPISFSLSPANTILSGIGVVGNTFDPAISGLGQFDLVATNTDANGCVGQAVFSIIVEDCASIDNLFYQGVSIQPNPNQGEFSVVGLTPNQEISIYNLHGQLVFSSPVLSDVMVIQMANINAGIYYLRTSLNGRIGQLKFAVI
jgi:carboxypeptidase T